MSEKAVYRQRDPRGSPYYQCVEDHFEVFEQTYDEAFAKKYGFFRPYLRHVIYRYLDCGDIHNGFARVRCTDCSHEYLLAFSCKRRHFCPSCHQKRVVEFGEWLCGHVLKAVPHRHVVLSIPKILRRYFLYDRSLLSELSRCAWESLRTLLEHAVPQDGAVPGAVIAIQTFGDFLGFNPHCHILCTNGCFYGNGMFRVVPALKTEHLEMVFRHNVFKMLLAKGKITEDLVSMLSSWRHSGFNVFYGSSVLPRHEKSMENLARYIIRASFSQERMTYVRQQSKVVYESKDGKSNKTFSALEWLAAMCSHVPNKGEQPVESLRVERMVRYYGYYSNVCRGKRQKAGRDSWIPYILEPDGGLKAYRKNWARLIQKIYEVAPLTCPKCHGPMRIISFIQDQEVIEKILTHLGLWLTKPKVPPRANAPPRQLEIDYSDSQIPICEEPFQADPDYPIDAYLS